MLFYFLGAAVFFFSAALALSFWSYSLLNRAIKVLRFSLELHEHCEVSRKEGSD